MLGLRLDEPLPLAGLERSLDDGELERLAGLGLVVRGRGSLALTSAAASSAAASPPASSPDARRLRHGAYHEAMRAVLSERQRDILRRVVEEYVATGQPVGSKTLVERAGLGVSPSTVRYELAELERLGLLTHPHTSAGRVPTEAGYRLYVDELLARPEPRPADFALELPAARAEVEEALQTTTEMLSQVTRLLALVSAPPLRGGDACATSRCCCCSRTS